MIILDILFSFTARKAGKKIAVKTCKVCEMKSEIFSHMCMRGKVKVCMHGNFPRSLFNGEMAVAGGENSEEFITRIARRISRLNAFNLHTQFF